MNNKFVAEYDPTIGINYIILFYIQHLFTIFGTEDAYKKEYTINDSGTEKNIVVEIIDTAGQEEFSAGLHDKVIYSFPLEIIHYLF